VQALADAEGDRCRDQAGEGDRGGPGLCEHGEETGDDPGAGSQRERADAAAALGRLDDRKLGEHHGRGVGQQQQPDQARPDPDRAGVGGHDPGQHAPPHGDHGDVDQREAHERAVAHHVPIAAGHGRWADLVAHCRDEDRQVGEVGHGVGQEERDESAEAEAGDDTADRGAEADPHVDRDARDRARALAQLAWGERGHQRRLGRVESSIADPGQGGRGDRERRRRREREAAVAAGQCDAGADRRRACAEAIDDGPGDRCDEHGDAGDQTGDEAGDAEAEAARLVQIDDLERKDRAVPEHAQEDPGLDDPQLARQAQREP
jgi:hypothetical protein